MQGLPISQSSDFIGICPNEWDSCAEYYIDTGISFRHDDRLDGGAVLYELYQPDTIQFIIDAIRRGVGENKGEVLYMGVVSYTSKYEILLHGIGSRQEMDEVQQDYFETTTQNFLNTVVKRELASNFHLTVDEQQVVGGDGGRYLRRRRLQQQGNQLLVTGQIRGERSVFLEVSEFDNTVDKAFKTNKSIYLEMLAVMAGLRPGPIAEERRYQFFTGINDAETTVTEIAGQGFGGGGGDSGGGGGSDVATIGIVVGVLGGLLAIVGLYFLSRWVMRKLEHRRNLRDYREKRAAEKLERRKSRENLQKLAEEQSQELQRERAPSIDGSAGGKTETINSSSSSVGRGPRPRKNSKDFAPRTAAAAPRDPANDRTLQQLQKLGCGAKPPKGKAKRSKSFDGNSSQSLAEFLDEHDLESDDPTNGKKIMGSSQSVDPGQLSRRGPPSRSKSDDVGGMRKAHNSLGGFMDRQPTTKDNAMSASKTVGPGIEDGGRRKVRRSVSNDDLLLMGLPKLPSGRNLTNKFPFGGAQGQIPPKRSKSADDLGVVHQQESPSLSGLIDQQPAAGPTTHMSGAQSVGPGPRPPHRSDGIASNRSKKSQNSADLAGFMEGQPTTTKKKKTKGSAQSVGPGMVMNTSRSAPARSSSHGSGDGGSNNTGRPTAPARSKSFDSATSYASSSENDDNRSRRAGRRPRAKDSI